MPSANPFVTDIHGEAAFAGAVIRQSTLPGAVNPYGYSASDVNAAGTSENIAMHVAGIVVFALVLVYVMRATGFKFVIAGSVG